jgi:hypothetical protein
VNAAPVRALAATALLGCAVLVLYALVLGLHFEDTPRAVADAARGEQVGYPAALGAVLAVVALLAAGRRWALVPLVGAVALAVVGLVIAVVG